MHNSLKEQYNQLETDLITSITQSYENHLVSNAVFLAERLHSEKQNSETKVILAECYLADGKPYKVPQILKECTHSSARYLLGMAYFKINKFEEAEKVLKGPPKDLRATGLLGTVSTPKVSNGGFGLYLLGQVYEKTNQFERALVSYQEAFKENGMLWVAAERIASLRKKEDKLMSLANSTALQNLTTYSDKMEEEKPTSDKFANLMLQEGLRSSKGTRNALRISQEKNAASNMAKKKLKKKVSLDSSPSTQAKELIFNIAKSYDNLVNFNISEALDGFNGLLSKQKNSAWVQSKIGDCYFFSGQYEEAAKYYKNALEIDPTRLEGVEYYSSCLWQLSKNEDLGSLAFRSFDLDPFAAETWISLGNCYSKMNDHETALKYFNRAIERDPSFSYAYTLRGHEYIYSEKFAEANKCYTEAIKVNPKSFFAYWGLGNVLLKQERFDKALDSFRTADKINSYHPIIKSSIGAAYMEEHRYEQACMAFEHAEKLDPKNSFIKYKKARALMKLNQNDQAIKILEQIKKQSPREVDVYLALGEIYQKNGDRIAALECFNIAYDLDPKEGQKIKNKIDSLKHGGVGREELGIGFY